MKVFEMVRNNDESNVSGTGSVLSGVIFHSGKVVVCWHSKSGVNSLGIYDNYYEFYFIHCASHPTNNTEIVFSDLNRTPVKRERRKICRHCKNEYYKHPRDSQNSKDPFVRSCSGNLVELSNEKIS